jgi:hypothetical protein
MLDVFEHERIFDAALTLKTESFVAAPTIDISIDEYQKLMSPKQPEHTVKRINSAIDSLLSEELALIDRAKTSYSMNHKDSFEKLKFWYSALPPIARIACWRRVTNDKSIKTEIIIAAHKAFCVSLLKAFTP